MGAWLDTLDATASKRLSCGAKAQVYPATTHEPGQKTFHIAPTAVATKKGRPRVRQYQEMDFKKCATYLSLARLQSHGRRLHAMRLKLVSLQAIRRVQRHFRCARDRQDGKVDLNYKVGGITFGFTLDPVAREASNFCPPTQPSRTIESVLQQGGGETLAQASLLGQESPAFHLATSMGVASSEQQLPLELQPASQGAGWWQKLTAALPLEPEGSGEVSKKLEAVVQQAVEAPQVGAAVTNRGSRASGFKVASGEPKHYTDNRGGKQSARIMLVAGSSVLGWTESGASFADLPGGTRLQTDDSISSTLLRELEEEVCLSSFVRESIAVLLSHSPKGDWGRIDVPGSGRQDAVHVWAIEVTPEELGNIVKRFGNQGGEAEPLEMGEFLKGVQAESALYADVCKHALRWMWRLPGSRPAQLAAAATPVAVTPAAATPVAATPAVATPVAATPHSVLKPKPVSEAEEEWQTATNASKAAVLALQIAHLENVSQVEKELGKMAQFEYKPPLKMAAATYSSSSKVGALLPGAKQGSSAANAETVTMSHMDKVSLLAPNAGVLTAENTLHRCNVVMDFGSIISGLSRSVLQNILEHGSPGCVVYKELDHSVGLGVEGVNGDEVIHVGNALLDLYIEGHLYRVSLPVLEGGELFILGNDFMHSRVKKLDVERQELLMKHCPDGKLCSTFTTPAITTLDGYYAQERKWMQQAVQKVANVRECLAYAATPLKLKPWSHMGMKLKVPITTAVGTEILVTRMADQGPNRTIARVAEGIYTVKVAGEVIVNVCNPSFTAHTFISDMEPLARITIGPDTTDLDTADLSLDELMDLLQFGDQLSDAEVDLFRPALAARLHYFSMKRIGRYHGAEVAIHTPKIDSGEVPPPFVGARRLAPEQYAAARAEFDKLVAVGVLTPSMGGGYGAPIVMVKKKGDGSGKQQWRMACDYRLLNALSTRDCHTLPNPAEALAALGKADFISAVDSSMAFHQLPLREQDKEKTCVSFPWGGYIYETLPFGIAGATSAFQRTMDMVLSGLMWTDSTTLGICQAYVDDVVIFTCGSLERHIEDVITVIDRLGHSGFVLKPTKCMFGAVKTEWLGHLCMSEGVGVVPSKVQAIMDIAPGDVMESRKQAKRFIMMIQYYSKFIADYTIMSKPLHELSNTMGAEFKVKAESMKMRAAVRALKQALCTAPVLMRPDFLKQMHLEVDTATKNGIGAVLSQEDDEGNFRPIAYWSKVFPEGASEKHWGVTQSECFGVVEALNHFRVFLSLAPGATVVSTDHDALQYLLKSKNLSGVMARYALQLAEFDFVVEYRPGEQMVVSDALSRLCKELSPKGVEGRLQQEQAEVSQLEGKPLEGALQQGPEPSLQQAHAPRSLWGLARLPREFEAVNLVLLTPNLRRMVLSGGSSEPVQLLRQEVGAEVSGDKPAAVAEVVKLVAKQGWSVTVNWLTPIEVLYLGTEAFVFYALVPTDVRLMSGKSLSMPTVKDLLAKGAEAELGALGALLRLWMLASGNQDQVLPRPEPVQGVTASSVAAAAMMAPASKGIALAAVAKQSITTERPVSLALLRGSEVVLVKAGDRYQLPGGKAQLQGLESLAKALELVLVRLGLSGEAAVELLDQAVRVSSHGAHQLVIQLDGGKENSMKHLPSNMQWVPLRVAVDYKHSPGRAVDIWLLRSLHVLYHWKALEHSTSMRVLPSKEELEVYLNTRAVGGLDQQPGATWETIGASTLGGVSALTTNDVSADHFYFAGTLARCRLALQVIWREVEVQRAAQREVVVVLDLEGPLRKQGRIDILQLKIGSFEFGFDLTSSAGVQALDGTPEAWEAKALRELLADTTIVKVVHSGGCDALALWLLYGVRLANCWDTCDADQVLNPVIENRQRGLAGVLKSWLDVSMSEKDKVEHDDNLWRQRPLTAQQLCYIAEDVTWGEELYQAQLEKSQSLGVVQYIRERSLRYWQSLPPMGARISLAVTDEDFVALRELDGELFLPASVDVDPMVFSKGSTIGVAVQLWKELFDSKQPSQPKGLKGSRVGSVMLHVANLPGQELSLLRDDTNLLEINNLILIKWSQLREQLGEIEQRSRACLERMLANREQEQRLGEEEVVETQNFFSPPTLPNPAGFYVLQQGRTFSCPVKQLNVNRGELQWMPQRKSLEYHSMQFVLKGKKVPVVVEEPKEQSVPKLGQLLEDSLGRDRAVVVPHYIAAVSGSLPAVQAAAILHDGRQALVFKHSLEHKALPRQAFQHGFNGSIVARLALQNKLGPVEQFSKIIKEAAKRSELVGRHGDTIYYSIEVPCLETEWAACHAAWRARDCTMTEQRAWLAFEALDLSHGASLGLHNDSAALNSIYLRGVARCRRQAELAANIFEQLERHTGQEESVVLSAKSLQLMASGSKKYVPKKMKGAKKNKKGTTSKKVASSLQQGEAAADQSSCKPLEGALQQGLPAEEVSGSLQQGHAAAGLDEAPEVQREPAPVIDDMADDSPVVEGVEGVALDLIPGLAADISTKSLLAHQWEDHFCRGWLEQLADLPEGEMAQFKGKDHFSMVKGVLYHTDIVDTDQPAKPTCVVIPVKMRKCYLVAFHDRLAHAGVRRVTEMLLQRVWWPKIRVAVRNYVRSCPTCNFVQRTRVQAGQARTLGNGDHPGDVWVADILTLPESPGGFCKIIVFADRASRVMVAEAFKEDPTSSQVIVFFVKRIVAIHGFPRAVISDRGSNLISAQVKDYYIAVGVAMVPTDSYHHNTAGLVERFMDTLKEALRSYLFDTGSESWELYLDYALLSYNSTVQSRMGFSPFYVLYGRDARFPVDLALLPLFEPRNTQMGTEAYAHARIIHSVWEMARVSLARAASKDRAKANASRDIAFKLQVGDQVLIRKPNLVGLEVPHHGPYRISKILPDDRVQIRDLHRVMHDEFHISRLKLYPYVDNDGNVAAARDEYLIEDILDSRTHEGVLQYKIKWVGWDKSHSSFEDADELSAECMVLVAAYEERIKAVAGMHLEGQVTASISDDSVRGVVPTFRSHGEQHSLAIPPGMEIDRSAVPEAAENKSKAQAKGVGKEKQVEQVKPRLQGTPGQGAIDEASASGAVLSGGTGADAEEQLEGNSTLVSMAEVDLASGDVLGDVQLENGDVEQRTTRYGGTLTYNKSTM